MERGARRALRGDYLMSGGPEFKCENTKFGCMKRNNLARVKRKTAARSLRRPPVFSEVCPGSVGGDSASGAGFGRGDALDFGERRDADIGNALLVDHSAAEGVTTGAFELAGLTQLGIDARFERGAAFGAGHDDITIGDAQGDGFRSQRASGGKGDQGEDETHGKYSGIERVS